MKRPMLVPLFLLTVLALFRANLGAQKERPPEQNAVGSPVGNWVSQTPILPDPAPQAANGEPADIIPIPQPDPTYRDRTTRFEVTQPDFTIITSLTAMGCTVTFSPPVQARTVPGSWATWGSPPDTESPTPRVLWTQGATQLTMTFSPGDCSFGTFGFEAEPNPFDTFPMTARFFSGDQEVGAITRDVSGSAGARLFAADAVDMSFTRVVFSSAVDFAVAQLRFALGGGGILTGTVIEADGGTPIAGATVEAVGGMTRSTMTGPDGVYRMRLPMDFYNVTASAFGFDPETAPQVEVDDGATTTQNFALFVNPNTRMVSGNVSDTDGNPLVNVPVTILNTPLPPARTDKNGNYTFAAVPPGTYQIRAGSGRCLSQVTQPLVVDQDDVVVDFTLNRPRDQFGYACDDGIDFNWMPGDTLLPLIGDDESMPVPLPFSFTFYGSTYNLIHVSTNGNGNFVAPHTEYVSVCIPSPGAIPALVAPYWDDLVVGPGFGSGRIWTKTQGDVGNRQFIIEWRDILFFARPGSVVTFEVIFDEATGSVTYQYNRTDGAGGTGVGATIGIQNQTGTVATQYACHEAGSVSVGKAVKIFLAQ